VCLDARALAAAQPDLTQSCQTIHVSLGAAVIALNGPWKFHVGDDPRKLFGFERVQEILAQEPISAAALADAAQKFGQEDDIGVISITRAEVLKPVLV
jgi:hypothetical protein